jgi:hypothetical protein
LLRCVGRDWPLADNLAAPAFVCFWTKADIPKPPINVRFRGYRRHAARRIFCARGLKLIILFAHDQVAYFCSYRYTPYSTEQGIISAEQGILAQEQGILPPRTKIIGG